MFDLNEVPDGPAVESGIGNSEKENRVSASSDAIDDGRIPNETPDSQPLAVDTSSSKDEGSNLLVEEATPVSENLPLKRHSPSSLSLEASSSKRQHVASPVAPVLGKQHNLDDRGTDLYFEEPDVDKQSASPRQRLRNESPDRSDLHDATDKVAFQFLGENSGIASTPQIHEQFSNGLTVTEQDKGSTGTILSVKCDPDPVPAPEGSVLGLSLGGIFGTSTFQGEALNLVHGTSNGTESYVPRSDDRSDEALPSSRVLAMSPFWSGKLCIKEVMTSVPIFAYCLGIMTNESKLKKLPPVLGTKRFLKFEELEGILIKGVTEPLILFKPSKEASMEDIKMYDSMVKTLSHGLKLHSPNSSGSVSGEINLPRSGKCACVAALISWDDDNVDAKLLLISNSGIQALMKFYKPGTIRHAFEDVDNLDTELLYGVLSSNSTGTLNRNPDSLLKNSTQDTGKITSSGSNKRLERVMEASITSSERAKDDMLVTNTGSPSKRKNQLSRPDTLMKSVSMQPIRSSSRDSKPNSESAKASKKYYEKQLSADRIRETTDKYHSRYSSGSRELDEDYEPGQSRHRDRSDWDSARQILRQEPRSERVRESLRRSRDDRDTTRQRGKDHYKTSYRDDEKDKSWRSRGKNEQQCDQDKSHSRAREKLLKEQSIEDLKSRSLLEKRGFISKTGSFSCRISPDENSNKHIRKRDREDEKSELSIKRTRASSMIDNKDLLKDGIDLHINPVLEQKLDQTLKATVLAVRPEPMEPIEEEHTLDAQASDIGYDDQGAKDYEAPDIVDEPEINDQEDLSRKFSLDVLDKETRNWLQSRQNAMYFEEEYGVRVYINADNSTGDGDSKSDAQTGLVSVRASVVPSDSHDISEDKWFLEQALAMLKSIASRGVFVKCLWYEGPVQIHEGDGAPSVPVIVKKIKGEDGKNLERIQHLTGVMIGVVLRRCGTGVSQEIDVVAQPRFIGLRIKCLRRKGLIEAIKEAEALLESVADHFSKELATHIATHIVELQSPTGHPSESVSNQSSPLASAMTTKDFLPHLLAKDENSLVSSKLNEVIKSDLVLGMESAPSVKEPDVHLSTEHEGNFRSLYASHLPDHMTTSKIQNIFEKLLREKLEPWTNLDHFPELVVDVRYIPDKSSAYIVLANEDLLDASLKLYAEDKSIFQGMRLELGPSEVNGSLAGSEPKKKKLGEHIRDAIAAKRESEKLSSREGAVDGDLDSDFSEDLWYADNLAPSTDVFPGRPRPLFLSELMRNASAPAIKQLFEEIITTYIGPNLVSASGRQLVLDVRYVPSRGCAFVDLATPELVEFMLDLHSRRPDVFLNMKMELGRRPVPYSVEEDGGGRLNLRLHGKPHSSSQMFDYWSPARKIIDKERNRSFDLEDPDRSDDLRWLNARMKKQRSDPEKTIYADRLPENSSEVTIQKVFERVLLQKLPREEMEALGDQIITEVRHVPTKYCAFIVFATEDLTRRVLHMYNQDEEVFESMRLKPHFHSRMEDFYKDELQEVDDVVHTPSVRERMGSLENDNARSRQLDIHDARSRSAAQRAITASAFREVDRRRSVYVDKIPEDLSESSMREIFEKVFRLKKHGRDGHMVSQVAYFRDKFDPSKLCAFVEVKTEDGTQDLVDYYNANQDAFRGMRVRPGFKYHH